MKTNKKILFFGTILSCALIIPTFTFAGFWDWIVGAITFIPHLLVIILLQVVILATGLLAGIMGSILTWVISPNFINVSYTSPANNPIIALGLQITGGFVNIGLVLALIVIAFTTILRIEHYDTKRLLAKLILVALLVNFAPVICGLIVDACNIVMHYFTQHVKGLSILTNTLRNIGDTLWRSIKSIKLTEQVATIVASLLFILFNLMLVIVLLVFTFLFVVRHVAIWLAVILAPIAFICWILPATKKWWDWWWNNFLGWCLIGVTAGFFLYLSAKISESMGQITEHASQPDIEETTLPATEFSKMLYQAIPIASLYIGLTLGLQTGAMGAGMVMNFARKTARRAADSKMVQRGLGTAAGAITAGTDRVGSWLRRMEQGARERGGVGGRVLGTFLGASAAYTERGSGLMARYFLPYAARARKTEIPKGFDELTPDDQARVVRGYASSRDRLQLGAHMARTGTLGKVSDPNFMDNMAEEAESAARNPATRNLLNKEINDVYSVLFDRMTAEAKMNLTSPNRRVEMQNRINERVQEIQHKMDTDPRYAEEIRNSGRRLEDIAAGAIHFEDLRPTEIAKLSPSSFRTIEARLGAERITPNKFATILANFDVNTAEGLLNAPGGWNYMLNQARTPEEQDELLAQFQRENPHLMRWFFMSETGRNIQFAGRERMRTQFEGYTNFQRGMEEAASILERMHSLRTINNQVVELQNRINRALEEGQAGRARTLTLNFREIERRSREMITAAEDMGEIREAYTNLSSLLSSPGFRRGEVYRTITSINADLRNRYRELTGGHIL